MLHTYYAVPSIAKTAVVGMRNHTGVESVTTGKRRGNVLFFTSSKEFVEAEEKIVFSGETDVKFSKVANPVSLFVFCDSRSKWRKKKEKYTWKSSLR